MHSLGLIWLLLMIASPVFAAGKNVVIIHSYSKDFQWTQAEERGFIKNFQKYGFEKKGWKVHRHYLNQKQIKDSKKLKALVKSGEQLIRKVKPALVYLTDDYATKSFVRYTADRQIPTVFAGVNAQIEDYGYARQQMPLLTGVHEANDYLGVVKLLKSIKPSLDSVLVVSEPDITGKAYLKNLRSQLNTGSGIRRFGLSYSEFLRKRSKIDGLCRLA